MISYLLGAPGSGKSSLVEPLRRLLPGHVVLDWDALMDPAGELAGAPIRRTPSTWPAYGRLVRTVTEIVGPRDVIMLGVCTPDELPDWPDGRWILLDCDDQERRRRLADRDDEGETQAALEDAAAYRDLGMERIDTGRQPLAEVAERIASMINGPMD